MSSHLPLVVSFTEGPLDVDDFAALVEGLQQPARLRLFTDLELALSGHAVDSLRVDRVLYAIQVVLSSLPENSVATHLVREWIHRVASLRDLPAVRAAVDRFAPSLIPLFLTRARKPSLLDFLELRALADSIASNSAFPGAQSRAQRLVDSNLLASESAIRYPLVARDFGKRKLTKIRNSSGSTVEQPWSRLEIPLHEHDTIVVFRSASHSGTAERRRTPTGPATETWQTWTKTSGKPTNATGANELRRLQYGKRLNRKTRSLYVKRLVFDKLFSANLPTFNQLSPSGYIQVAVQNEGSNRHGRHLEAVTLRYSRHAQNGLTFTLAKTEGT